MELLRLQLILLISSMNILSAYRYLRRPSIHHNLNRLCSTIGNIAKEGDYHQRNVNLLAMELPNNQNSDNLLKTRHTASHVLAMAVQKLFPKVKVTIGPWIENG